MSARVALLALALLVATGCGYRFGNEPAHGLEDIACPIFVNKTLRRGLEHQLTAEVRRLILETTPLHLAREGSARAILKGTVTAASEQVLIPGAGDTIVESSIAITVEVQVVERTSGRILVGRDTDGDGRPDAGILLTDSQNWVPQSGGTRESATARVLRDLGERIVQLLEKKWGGAQGD